MKTEISMRTQKDNAILVLATTESVVDVTGTFNTFHEYNIWLENNTLTHKKFALDLTQQIHNFLNAGGIEISVLIIGTIDTNKIMIF